MINTLHDQTDCDESPESSDTDSDATCAPIRPIDLLVYSCSPRSAIKDNQRLMSLISTHMKRAFSRKE